MYVTIFTFFASHCTYNFQLLCFQKCTQDLVQTLVNTPAPVGPLQLICFQSTAQHSVDPLKLFSQTTTTYLQLINNLFRLFQHTFHCLLILQ
uniref:Uncharacterized protein n=1 Tax=Arundo donax TaxID=35708 RepID=A0A0A9ADI8_ARUDO